MATRRISGRRVQEGLVELARLHRLTEGRIFEGLCFVEVVALLGFVFVHHDGGDVHDLADRMEILVSSSRWRFLLASSLSQKNT